MEPCGVPGTNEVLPCAFETLSASSKRTGHLKHLAFWRLSARLFALFCLEDLGIL